MVRRYSSRCALVALALLGARSAGADPITFTGNVANDFPAGGPGVMVTPVDSDPLNKIYEMPQMQSAGLINGYAIKDIRTSYDVATDTLYVGVNTYSIAGTAVGTGGATFDAILNKYGGVDEPSLGGQKSITVAFAPDGPNGSSSPGNAVAVAGVPANKASGGPGTDHFTVASYSGGAATDIENHYGATLTNNLGALAFDPSSTHPNFEFTIKNFSTISGLNPSQGFWIMAYAGSPNDGPIGEETLGWTRLPALAAQQAPEPATWLAWSVLVGGAAWRFRRRAAL